MVFCIQVAIFWIRLTKDRNDIRAPWDKKAFKRDIQQKFEEIFFVLEFEDHFLAKGIRKTQVYLWNLFIWKMVIEPAFEFLLVPNEVDKYLREYGKSEHSSFKAIREFMRYRTRHGSSFPYTVMTLIFAVFICAFIRKYGQYENDKNRLKAKNITLYRWFLERIFANVASCIDNLIVEQDKLYEEMEDRPLCPGHHQVWTKIKNLDCRICELRNWRKTIIDFIDSAAAVERQLSRHSSRRLRDLKAFKHLHSTGLLNAEMTKFETTRLARNDKRIIVADEQAKSKYWYAMILHFGFVMDEKIKSGNGTKFDKKWSRYLKGNAKKLLYERIEKLSIKSKKILTQDLIEIFEEPHIKEQMSEYDWELFNELLATLQRKHDKKADSANENEADAVWREEWWSMLKDSDSIAVLQRVKALSLEKYLQKFAE